MDKNTPVASVMTNQLITLHPEDSMNIVEETFAKKSFHHIPIVDVNKHILGMVSKTDLLQLSAIKQELSEREYKMIKIKDFMTRTLVLVDPATTIARAAEIFFQNKFHALPVVENDRLAGIITTHDLLGAAFDLAEVAHE